MNDNNRDFNEKSFRTKRTENDYNNQSNQRIILNFDINKTEKEIDSKNENIDLNYNKNYDNNNDFINENENILDLNSFYQSNEIPVKNYENFQSFLQLNPKEGIELPREKYYNFIFNIGSPSN